MMCSFVVLSNNDDDDNAIPARGHEEVSVRRRSAAHIMVTTPLEYSIIVLLKPTGIQIATQSLPQKRSIHPRTSETIRVKTMSLGTNHHTTTAFTVWSAVLPISIISESEIQRGMPDIRCPSAHLPIYQTKL